MRQSTGLNEGRPHETGSKVNRKVWSRENCSPAAKKTRCSQAAAALTSLGTGDFSAVNERRFRSRKIEKDLLAPAPQGQIGLNSPLKRLRFEMGSYQWRLRINGIRPTVGIAGSPAAPAPSDSAPH